MQLGKEPQRVCNPGSAVDALGHLFAGRPLSSSSQSAAGTREAGSSLVTARPSVGCRFPRLHSAVIRTFVLVQHYAAAMMAVSGLSQMKNYTSVETLEITQNLINSPKQCPCGHGLMVLLRVPCSPLAAVAYERLAHVRARLALDEHFEIILGNPSSGITVGKHFVKQLKVGAVFGDRRAESGRQSKGACKCACGDPGGEGATEQRQTPQCCRLPLWPPLVSPPVPLIQRYQSTYKCCCPKTQCLAIHLFLSFSTLFLNIYF